MANLGDVNAQMQIVDGMWSSPTSAMLRRAYTVAVGNALANGDDPLVVLDQLGINDPKFREVL